MFADTRSRGQFAPEMARMFVAKSGVPQMLVNRTAPAPWWLFAAALKLAGVRLQKTGFPF